MLGGAVGLGIKIGLGLGEDFPEIGLQICGQGGNVLILDSGIRIPGALERRLPAHQGAEAAQGVHQPVTQQVGSGAGQ